MNSNLNFLAHYYLSDLAEFMISYNIVNISLIKLLVKHKDPVIRYRVLEVLNGYDWSIKDNRVMIKLMLEVKHLLKDEKISYIIEYLETFF